MTGRKLGRGLDMLITKEPEAVGVEVLQLDPQSIDPNPDQPRKKFSMSELEMLKTSISREGLLQPVVVRRVGERRTRLPLGQPNHFTLPQQLLDATRNAPIADSFQIEYAHCRTGSQRLIEH